MSAKSIRIRPLKRPASRLVMLSLLQRPEDNKSSAVAQLGCQHRAGTEVKIEIMRDDKKKAFTRAMGGQSSKSMAAAPSEAGKELLSKLGLNVQTLTSSSENNRRPKLKKVRPSPMLATPV